MNLPIIIIIIILKILLIFPSLHFYYGCLLFSSIQFMIFITFSFSSLKLTWINFFFLFSALTSWDDQWWWWWWSGNHHQGMQSPHLPFQFSLFSHTFFQRSFKVFITIIIIFDDQSSIWFDLIDSMIFDVANLSFFWSGLSLYLHFSPFILSINLVTWMQFLWVCFFDWKNTVNWIK